MARLSWLTAARGGRVFPILLIHGLGIMVVPAGTYDTVTSVALTDIPPFFWPGDDIIAADGYLAQWLEIGEGREGFSWSEQSRPTEPGHVEIAEISVRLSDVGGAATALFDSEDSALGSYLTQEVTPTDTTVHVVSTAGFAASGVIYLNRETIAYASKTSTSFTGCTRGVYGSPVQRHPFDAAAGSGLGTAEVTDRPVEIVGRLCSLWMGEVENGVWTKLGLEYLGHVGVGPQTDPESGAWTLRIDHASKALSQKPRAGTVTVGGYVHAGNRGARVAYEVEGVDVYGRNLLRDGTTPVADLLSYIPGGTAWRYAVALTEDAAEPDLGGWHPDRQSYVDSLNQAVLGELAAGDSLSYRIEADHLVAEWTFATPAPASLHWAFDYNEAIFYPPDVTTRTSGRPLPEAWVPMLPNSRVYLGALDYAVIPPVPTVAAGDNTAAYWALVWDEPGDEGPQRRAVKVLSNTSAGGVNYVTITPVVGAAIVGRGGGVGGAAFRRNRGFLVTQPTVCRVVLAVSSDSWVTALESAVTVFSDDLGDGAAEVFDWDRIREVAATYGGPFARRREYLIDADTSVLDFVANEMALQGFCVVPWRGRLAIARVAEFAATETRQGAITTATLSRDAGPPGYSRGEDGICNTFMLEVPEANLTLNFVDQTSRKRYGPSRAAITATLPGGMVPRSIDGAQLAASLTAMAETVLGPLRYPYRHVDVTAMLLHAGLQIGDLVSLTLFNIPNGSGTLGLPGPSGLSVAQVVSRTPVLFRDGTDGLVQFTLRLSPTQITGWAPGALVADGGITGAVVTLDTTTFGAAGCAQAGTDGGASTFAMGDKVRLVELDNDAPTTSTQHEVTAVAGPAVTLSPAPNFAFAALAGTGPVRIAVVFDDSDVVVPAQLAWAFLADAGGVLTTAAGSTRARRYAS